MNKSNIINFINLGLELIPVVLFFIGGLWNIYMATAFLMVGSIVSIIIYYLINNKLPILTIALAILALLFGALTLIFHKSYIIKIKVTILNILIAIVFFSAAFWKKNIIAPITPRFARKPSVFIVINNSWGIFFVLMAITNEIVWRRISDQAWVYFKTFAIPSSVIIFGLIQVICILLYIFYRKNRLMNKKHLPKC